MNSRMSDKADLLKIGKAGFHSFRYFLLISPVAIVVILIVALLGLRSILLGLVLYESENDASRVSQAISEFGMKRFLGLNQDSEDLLVISAEEFPQLDRELRSFLAPFDIFKIKVFNAETRIIYSTDSKIIGILDPDNEKLLKALGGSLVSKYESKDSAWDLDNEERTNVEIVETYVPIRGLSGKIIGSFEIYKDVTPKIKMAKETMMRAGAVLIFTVLFVFSVLMFVIRRATIVIDTHTTDLMHINKRLTQEVEERICLQKEILSVSEQEQRRIGRELHDGLGQQLTGISFMSKALGRKLNNKSLVESADAEQIVKLINQTIDQVRGLSRGLHPVDVENKGLASVLKELATSAKTLFGIQCVFQDDQTISINDDTMTVQLYRIVQEAISNAFKHGKANHVQVKLASSQDHLTLTVENDGLVFPAEKIKEKGMGLHIMKYRAEMIGGTFCIERGGEGGTIVTCVFPNKQHFE